MTKKIEIKDECRFRAIYRQYYFSSVFTHKNFKGSEFTLSPMTHQRTLQSWHSVRYGGVPLIVTSSEGITKEIKYVGD